MERKAFTISRATWHRGQTCIGSRLLVPDTGKMCCLGSIALQAGATPAQIRNVPSPGALWGRGVRLDALAPLAEDKLHAADMHHNTIIARRMMEANDDCDITDAERETKLTDLAATIGWDLTFTD